MTNKAEEKHLLRATLTPVLVGFFLFAHAVWRVCYVQCGMNLRV